MPGKSHDGLPPRRNCGTMAVHMKLLEKHPSFTTRLLRLEEQTARLKASGLQVTALPKVVVKTVVHVVHNTVAQNISASQIASQIRVLNRDYGATNTDRSKVPTPWKGLITDTRIGFKLVKITRTKTSVSSFHDDDGVKAKATGGMPPYRPASHLNIWVCPLGDQLLGYAQFPGGPPATDGV